VSGTRTEDYLRRARELDPEVDAERLIELRERFHAGVELAAERSCSTASWKERYERARWALLLVHRSFYDRDSAAVAQDLAQIEAREFPNLRRWHERLTRAASANLNPAELAQDPELPEGFGAELVALAIAAPLEARELRSQGARRASGPRALSLVRHLRERHPRYAELEPELLHALEQRGQVHALDRRPWIVLALLVSLLFAVALVAGLVWLRGWFA
jgi:hypothetical protein